MAPSNHHIEWFRHTSPYIRAHRGRTFVIYLGNGALESDQFNNLINDLCLLHLLGIRLVLVHATRSEVEQALVALGITGQLHQGIRITDAEVLGVVRDVSATQRLQLESQLSQGLPDSPMHGARLRVVSGNFITARPVGIVDGVDFLFTGAVRRLDAVGMTAALDNQAIVLLSPLGFSTTGEVFNLSADEVATATAIALGADKLIFMGDTEGLKDNQGTLVRQCTVAAARALPIENPIQASQRDAACRACEQGVSRAHFLSYAHNGALIEELFSHDGAGTLVSEAVFEQHRRASIDDIAGVLDLVKPLEETGVLVRRSRERFEQEITNFTVLERDGRVLACAALYPFEGTQTAEIACIATHPDYRNSGRGMHLLELLQTQAQEQGIRQLFVLTTQTTHWFIEQGFVDASLDQLPSERQALYNLQRNSKVLIKSLD
ncbi:N-acetylglutamate synthase [marine gamma proteobacterium HTCC2080]|nr:N-acetylglutamate synthase [marine gamma proteobacterium HTCC2080]